MSVGGAPSLKAAALLAMSTCQVGGDVSTNSTASSKASMLRRMSVGSFRKSLHVDGAAFTLFTHYKI